MFERFFRRGKSRLFLGELAVVPRKDFKRHLEQWGMFGGEGFDDSLRRGLQEIFALPPAGEATEITSSDLGLDVLIPSFQSGAFGDLSLGEIGVPVFWRPKVTVACRLYYLKSKKIKSRFWVTKKMPWGKFIGRIFSWRGVSPLQPTFDAEDMNRLLYEACYLVLERLRMAA